MSTGSETKDVRLFDIRVVERNIKKGLITRKDQEKFLKSLPDATEKVAEATEYVPGLTAAEMNEAALASASVPGSHYHQPIATPSASDDLDGFSGADEKVVAAADDDAGAEEDDEEDEDEDEDEGDTDDGDADDGEPPPAA